MSRKVRKIFSVFFTLFGTYQNILKWKNLHPRGPILNTEYRKWETCLMFQGFILPHSPKIKIFVF